MATFRRRRRRRLPSLLVFALRAVSTSCVPFVVEEEEKDARPEQRTDEEGDNDQHSDLPPMLDSDDVAYFASTRDLDGLHWALSTVFRRSARNPDAREVVHPELPAAIVSKGGGSTYSTEYKLLADLEQAEWLVTHRRDRLGEAKAVYFEETVVPALRDALAAVPPLEELSRTHGLFAFPREDTKIREVYNKALHAPEYDYDPDDLLHENLLARVRDGDLGRAWRGEDGRGRPGIVVVDDLLSPATLAVVRSLALESTVWYQTKMPERFGGYVGAYVDDGLHQRVLLDAALALHGALRDAGAATSDQPLRYMWAYKYDSEFEGIRTHADQAAVNVNVWLTPDEANEDPDSGGLVVYTAKPPPDWDFARFNNLDDDETKERLLGPSNYANVTIPYRYNRAVIFDSALFHHTDRFRFKKGHENRRINLTILYGDMSPSSTECAADGTCAKTTTTSSSSSS